MQLRRESSCSYTPQGGTKKSLGRANRWKPIAPCRLTDGMTIDEFPDWAKSGEWKRMVTELETVQYQPAPVRRVEIDKPDGGTRQLGIPTVLDRVIQQAIAQVLTPIFDPGFSDHSFGFRPGRNGQQAVKRVQRIINEGRRISVDVDLSKFFDRVNHDLLMTYLGRKVKDKRLLRLIKLYLRAVVINNQLYSESREGVPQGGPLSPLLANIMLDPLDKELENRGHKFAWYAAGLITLVSPTATNSASIWIIGLAVEYGWHIGDSGVSRVPK